VFVVLDAVATMDLDLLRRQRFVQQAQPCIDAARRSFFGERYRTLRVGEEIVIVAG
jgi:hypothetical protein